MEALAQQCQKERHQTIISRKDVAQEQSRKDLELQQLIQDLEIKYEKQWNPVKTYNSASENLPRFNIDKSSKIVVNSDLSGTKDTDFHTDNSESCSVKDLKDDPFVLRSYLNDNVSSYNSPEIGSSSTPISCQTNNEMENTDYPDVLSKRGKKLTRKKKWEPDQEWVSDFSGLNERSGTESIERKGHTHRPQTGLLKKSKDQYTPNVSNHPVTSSCDDITCNVAESCKLDANKIKKNSCTYKPHLYVANRTLNLRRTGSLSGLNPSDHGDHQDACQIKESICDKSRSGASEIYPQSVKPKQKSANVQKRNSWR